MSSHNTSRVARYAACALTALAFGAVAHAGDASGSNQVAKAKVSYADLNLAKQADAKILYERLQSASHQVCAQYDARHDLAKQNLYNVCYRQALARAVEGVDHATVRAEYAADENVRIASRSMKSRAST